MNETKPKKMVSRSVAIALVIICVVLLGSLAYFVIADNSAQNSIKSLQAQVKDLNDTVQLTKSSILLENHTVSVGGFNEWFSGSIKVGYAGYLLIGASSTSNDAWLVVEYTHSFSKTSLQYHEVVNLTSIQQWNAFPILPTNGYSGTGANVFVGCYTENANVTLSIIYYY